MTQQISATEAARSFADILDAIEHTGKRFVVVRRGRAVAELSPPTAAPDLELPMPDPRFSDLPDDVAALLRPDSERVGLLHDLLNGEQRIGYRLSPPGGVQRQDYVNITKPGQRGRTLSVNARTGRAEFQNNSWERIGSLSDRFARLAAGNKAAHPLESVADLARILDASRHEFRR